jgi:Zn-dependent M28 family amino/carboxypeptidase
MEEAPAAGEAGRQPGAAHSVIAVIETSTERTIMKRIAMFLLAPLILTACNKDEGAPSAQADPDTAAIADTDPALMSINGADILTRIKALSDDSMEGRSPGTIGEERAVAYITNQFKALGLKPGNPNGTYTQDVPLAGITSKVTGGFDVNGKKIDVAYPANFVGVTRRVVPSTSVKASNVVFVGYGVVAPEYNWDDYKGVDVRGKTIIMLVNDPAVKLANDTSKLDTTMFRGPAMTYYGRWTYKYEIAAEKGAAAVIIVHETGPAGYPFDVVTGSWGSENFDIERADKNMGRTALEGWITLDKAKELFAAAGKDFDALHKAASTKEFKPVDLGAKANFTVNNTIRHVKSKNVVALLEGADSAKKNEYVIYTAHWDHLGRDTTIQGDQIFNGALDNAAGVASILEVAEAFTKAATKPARSIIFMSVTAEEQGLLGAKWYATNPLYPLNKTLANINVDGVNQWGRTKDLVLIGLGNSTVDDVAQQVAAERHRTISPDPEPGKGFFYRSDHFEFAKEGVPALDPDAGTNFIGKDAGYGQKKRDEYTNNDYHKPSDQVKPDWDLTGAAEDSKLFYLVGYRIANGATWPEWKPGTEFKAKREASLKSGK